MTEPAGPYDLVYVHTDIPEGMTIRDWRAHGAAKQLTVQAAARADRHQRHARRTRRWLAHPRVPVRPLRLRSRQAHE